MQESYNISAAMQEGKPLRSYRKTVPAKVLVTVLDPIRNIPEQILLTGQPGEDGSIVDLYTDKEILFFLRMNKYHLNNGYLIQFTRPENQKEVETPEQYTDEKLLQIVNSKFLALQNFMSKTKSEALIFRLRQLAVEADKSDKILAAIDLRLAEIQGFTSKEE